MTAAEAKAIIAALVDAGASAEAIAAAAKTIIDAGATAGAVTPAAGAAIAARTAPLSSTERSHRFRAKARNAGCNASVACNVASVAPVSSSSFSSTSVDDDGDGDDARARPADQKLMAEKVTTEIEQIVQTAGKWRRGGWNHSAVVMQVERRLNLGVSPTLMLDAARNATGRATGIIYSLNFFDPEITRGQAQAMDQGRLPLSGVTAIRGCQNGGDSLNVQNAAAEAAADIIELVKRQSSDLNGGG